MDNNEKWYRKSVRNNHSVGHQIAGFRLLAKTYMPSVKKVYMFNGGTPFGFREMSTADEAELDIKIAICILMDLVLCLFMKLEQRIP
jgi:hypothetical protein